MIHIRVPATTANLGPGFDCMGMALSIYGNFFFEEREEGLFFENVEERYQNQQNLAVRAYDYALDRMGEKRRGLYLKIETDIPVARGLGSSASLIAAGIEAACRLHHRDIDVMTKLQWATALEGHPDNVAPALLGGMTVSFLQDEKAWSAACPVSKKIKGCVLIPPFRLSTQKARSVLPRQVTMAQAVFNVSHGAALIKAMETGDMPLLQAAMRDRLHESYREPLIEGGKGIRRAAVEMGAAACVISGAGPSLLCLYEKEGFVSSMQAFMEKQSLNWRVVPVETDQEGTVALEE